jgi:hypothetical protein
MFGFLFDVVESVVTAPLKVLDYTLGDESIVDDVVSVLAVPAALAAVTAGAALALFTVPRTAPLAQKSATRVRVVEGQELLDGLIRAEAALAAGIPASMVFAEIRRYVNFRHRDPELADSLVQLNCPHLASCVRQGY